MEKEEEIPKILLKKENNEKEIKFNLPYYLLKEEDIIQGNFINKIFQEKLEIEMIKLDDYQFSYLTNINSKEYFFHVFALITDNMKQLEEIVFKKSNEFTIQKCSIFYEYNYIENFPNSLKNKFNNLECILILLHLFQIISTKHLVWNFCLSNFSLDMNILKENPPLVIQKINFENKNFFVIRDDLLVGGTKQRALINILSNHFSKEFVYAGPDTGYAQIALAYASKLTNKNATIFIAKRIPTIHSLSKFARLLGANIKEVYPPKSPLKRVQEEAQKYTNMIISQKGNNYITLLPFGLHFKEFIDILSQKIKEAIPHFLLQSPPKRIWVPVGSGALMNALHSIWPQSQFLLVQVGKKIWPDMIESMNAKIYIAPEFFTDRAKILPPYPSVSTYDAKVWQFVIKDGEDQDFIWNVGCDINN